MSVRVKIVLSKIFKDYRKEAFILLKDDEQKFKHVRDFESHIQKTFNIRFGIYLTIGDSLLPSSEHISVIHSGDTIIVNKLNEEIGDTVNEFQQQSTEVDIDNQSNDEINPFKRGKRIRKRKKKQVTAEDVKVQNVSTIQTDEPAVIVQPRSTRSHIRFSNDNPDLPSLNSEVLPSKCVARVVRPVTVLSEANADSLRSDNHASDKSLCTPNCQPDIVTLKECANDSNFAKIVASIDFERIVKSIDDSVDFVPLKDEPKIYDVIAFKMLKIGKNYEPQLSEWIVAMVKDVEDLDIAVHVLAGVEETECPDGKLSMAMMICEEETESSNMITLKREDLLNVKVFYNK
ncbi:uncharacterized protein LOC119083093 [Bradysia coprophila]|uniref:uncharacterized protein LOC119083093 n=1 Tax=Bradysia coprophila TaxID=38358 RepID=UPI00187DA2B6|nr:uncharacterized protein LOC119083093 [Bradysia coprophila]